jgi:hypothetical protein
MPKIDSSTINRKGLVPFAAGAGSVVGTSLIEFTSAYKQAMMDRRIMDSTENPV